MEQEWMPLSLFRARFQANIEVLARRDPILAEKFQAASTAGWHISTDTSSPQLGREVDARVLPVAAQLAPLAIASAINQLCPTHALVEPVTLVGLDSGALWEAIYDIPCRAPMMAGHRSPLFFLTRDPAHFAAVLHLNDWTKLLADPRVHLFVGTDAVEQCHQYQLDHPRLAACRLSATLDPSLWPAGMNADRMFEQYVNKISNRHTAAKRRLDRLTSRIGATGNLRSTEGLRILGVTSRFTTFLQHSMNDWLAGMNELGHETRLVIEAADHEVTSPLSLSQEILSFEPDLILMIDHFRGELSSVPANVPVVMWVQDCLPTIYCESAGAAQGANDYCLGFGGQVLASKYGFPKERFMPAPMGVNLKRFSADEGRPREFDCDLSFVSHASTPASELLSQRIKTADGPIRKLMDEVYQQMVAVYERGETLPHAMLITRMIDAGVHRIGLKISSAVRQAIDDFFTGPINNALFRHQALGWAAGLGVNLQLWGKGWEQHPTLGRFAMGQACNQSQLRDIYRRSSINLQIVPTGAVHQRMLDGLAAGGFFLVRPCGGDFVESHYQRLWKIGQRYGWTSSEDFRASAQPSVRQSLQQIESLLGVDPFKMHADLFEEIEFSAAGGFVRSAESVWPEYSQITFDSPKRLAAKVKHYLAHPDAREQIVEQMRQPVVERFAYRSISSRLLSMIVADRADRTAVRIAA